jgi:hypothetical protein
VDLAWEGEREMVGYIHWASNISQAEKQQGKRRIVARSMNCPCLAVLIMVLNLFKQYIYFDRGQRGENEQSLIKEMISVRSRPMKYGVHDRLKSNFHDAHDDDQCCIILYHIRLQIYTHLHFRLLE